MQPLGLTASQLNAYHQLLARPHDFTVTVDILNMEEKLIGSATDNFLDGQINLQRDGTTKRTATISLHDPDSALNLDADSPFSGAVYADRIVRARHTVTLPGVGDVTATPFLGPVVKVTRDGDNLSVECQDKTLLAVEGCPPKTVKKGRNAVGAIREILEDCTGERRFRFPQQHKARLTQAYTVGWTTEASPWKVCQKIAAQINMQLLYSCDGAAMLRRRPTHPVLEIATGGMLTGPLRTDYDITRVRNHVRVTGEKNKKAKIKIAAVAEAPATHPSSPKRLGRHGVPRYLPMIIEDSGIKKESVARQRAKNLLDENLPMGVSTSFSSVPFFHLDYSDLIRVVTDDGAASVPFVNGSIPLGLGGDAEVGSQRQVSRPRRLR